MAYNIGMSLVKSKTKLRLALQILLTAASIGWIAFIFGNSLRTGAQSSAQSSTIVRLVQKTVGIFAPNSWIVNATGEDYLRLHNFVRKAAHFIEFAVLGGLLCWCYFSYTLRIKWSFIPAVLTLAVPVLDELLQKTVAGRAGTVTDALIDMSGGVTGFAVAALVVWLLVKIAKRREHGREKSGNRAD